MPLPTWHSQGDGSKGPSRVAHKFGWNSLKEGARLDMQRGAVSDDLANAQWNSLLDGLPKYLRFVLGRWGTNLTENNRGNAMEMACGLAYATARHGATLPDGQAITYHSTDSKKAWAACWPFYAELGLTPLGDVPPLGSECGSDEQPVALPGDVPALGDVLAVTLGPGEQQTPEAPEADDVGPALGTWFKRQNVRA